MSDITAPQLLKASSALALAWARRAVPFYGPSGSMDADVDMFESCQGPSYYNQFAHFPLLLLADGTLPGATPEEQKLFRQCALRNIRYMMDITDSEFKTPHFSRGRDWGRMVGEWSNYFLLHSMMHLEASHADDECVCQQLRLLVHGAVEHIHRTWCRAYGDRDKPATSFPGNHSVWHALLLYEAGLHFGRLEWQELGQDFMRRWVIPLQLQNGSWPEGGGIVVNYAMVTAQALSLYAESASDVDACRGVMRFLEFCHTMAFPDGTSSVVADCRMRYHGRPMVFLPPSFLRSEMGRRECLTRIQGCLAACQNVDIRQLGVQGLAFFALFPWFLSQHDLADIHGGEHPCPVIAGLPLARIDNSSWTGFLSWQLNEESPSRFHIDTQNFIELWHADSKYLVGGGNSKAMPRFSTIRRCNHGRAYVPYSARALRTTAEEAVVEYGISEDRIVAGMALGDAARIGFRVAHRADDETVYEAALTLPVSAGEDIVFGTQDGIRIEPGTMTCRSFAHGGVFRWRGRTFNVPSGTAFDYPVIPHNPYRQDGLPEPGSYVARLSWRISATESFVTIS